MKNTVIMIPSRLKAKRLPNKPLLDIAGIPMIAHVLKRAQSTDIKNIFVTTPDVEIEKVVFKHNGKAIITSHHHLNGTDRIHEALTLIKDKYDIVINLQGDMPDISPKIIEMLNNYMVKNPDIEVSTLSSLLSNSDIKKKNVVKVQTKNKININEFSDAIDFFRCIYNTKGNIYHHIGIYAYRINTLKKFILFNKTRNEIKRSLEQMRLIDNKINIKVGLTKDNPISVDTNEDIIKIRKSLK